MQFKGNLEQIGVNRPPWRFHLTPLLPPGSRPPAPLPTPQRQLDAPAWGGSICPPGAFPRPAFQKPDSHIHLAWGKLPVKSLIIWKNNENRTPQALLCMQHQPQWPCGNVLEVLCTSQATGFVATWKDTRLWTGQQRLLQIRNNRCASLWCRTAMTFLNQKCISSLEGQVGAGAWCWSPWTFVTWYLGSIAFIG